MCDFRFFLTALLSVCCNVVSAADVVIDEATKARCFQVLRQGVRSSEFWPSMHAAEGLTRAGRGSEVLALLSPRLPTVADDQQRCGIAREMVRAGAREKTEVMLQILAGEDDFGHVHAAESLYKVGEIGDGKIIQAVFAKTRQGTLKLMAAAALGRTGDPAALQYLRDQLESDDEGVLQIAAWVLGRIGAPDDAISLREQLIRTKTKLTQVYIEHALAALGDEEGLRDLTRNLDSEDAATRTYAATFAGDARALVVAPKLIERLDDENLDVRIRAAQTLLEFSLMRRNEATKDFSFADQGLEKDVYEHYALQARNALQDRQTRYAELKTDEDCEKWQRVRKEFFLRQLGGLPPRTPLNAKVVGRLDGDDYLVEKVIYDSRPNHRVTAAMYLPKSAPPYPAVLIACGHSKNGKAADYNQRMGIMLAKHGVAAFCYDPIGQGERSQILEKDATPKHPSTTEHILVGVGAMLTGTNTAQYRIWDGIRGLDYLVSRKDIMAERLGCTGCSGGGTLTSYIMALDDRVFCAAPACYLTTFQSLVETIGPQDAEQNIFGQIAFGMDHADYVLMRAPRPTLICCSTEDYFAVEGTWESFRQAKRFYGRLGYAERVDLVEADGGHGVKVLTREAMVRWMRRWLLGVDGAVKDLDFPVWSVEDLQCTPMGEVLRLPGERSVFDLNLARAESLRAGRPQGKALTAGIIRTVTGIRPLRDLPDPRVHEISNTRNSSQKVRQLLLETEKGLRLPALRWVPSSPTLERVLLLHDGGIQNAATSPVLQQQLTQGRDVVCLDIRGMGATRSGKTTDQNGDWKTAYLAYLMGESLVKGRVEDILCCARWLKREGKLRLIADGECAIAALHAAAVEPELFDFLEVELPTQSWHELLGDSEPWNQTTNAIHGVLKYYDLPELVELAHGVGDE